MRHFFCMLAVGGICVLALAQGASADAEPSGRAQALRAGARFRVTRTALVRGSFTLQDGQQFPLRMLRQVEFVEEVRRLREGRAAEVSRELVKAEVRQTDPETGAEDVEVLGRAGQSYRLSFGADGSRISPEQGGYPGENLAEALKDPLDCGLLPPGEIRGGQTWSLNGDEISRNFASLAMRGGQARLRVVSFERDRDTDLRVARIQGEISTQIMLDELSVSYEAKVEAVIPVELRVPFMVKLEGRLSGRGTLETEEGQVIIYVLSGEASALQMAAPTADAVRAAGGGSGQRPQAAPAAGTTPMPAPDRSAPSARPITLVCRRVHEPREKAFTFLLPRGWKVQGGIVRVNPLQAGGPANAIAAKCDMTVSRDDSESVSFRILPSVEFAEPPPTVPGAGMFPPGSNYQGMVVRPMLSPPAFLRECFQQLRPRAEQARIVEEKPLPEMAAAYEKAFALLNRNLAMAGLPGIRASAGALVVDYTEGDTRYKEAMVTAILDKRGCAFSWCNDSTYAARAPSAEADAWKPVLEVISRSIQFDPRWLAREARGQDERTRIVLDTMREIHRIQEEMRANSERVRSKVHEENYLVLTDQEDYVNPFTQKVERDTAVYERRWVTETGDIIYTNDRNYNPNQDMTVPRTQWCVAPVKPR